MIQKLHPEGLKIKTVPSTGPVVAERVGRGIALLFQDHGTSRG